MMGKAKTKAALPMLNVTIKYDLFELPTAQHKAGLAGLILQIQSMHKRRVAKERIPEITFDRTSATVVFTESSTQGLFDDLYDASFEQIEVKAKWQGQQPIAVKEVDELDEKTKTTKKTKRFVYEIVQPTGHFLRHSLPNMDAQKGWLKLWRDMLWSIPRGNPQSRQPFEQRARDELCKEGKVAWDDLVKVANARSKSSFHTSDVAGSLWLGAQAVNAESIPFQGRAEQTVLLHFWPLTAQVYVPQQIDSDGDGQFDGYVLAIPEIADLEDFVETYPAMLGQLTTEVRGFRPAEAVIDLPAEGAISFLEHLGAIAHARSHSLDTKYAVASVEFLHLAKIGNNIKSLAAGRVVPRSTLLEHYRKLIGLPGHAPPYRNPLFRRGLVLALLNEIPWYEPMGDMLVQYPWPFFVRADESPRTLPWFWQDTAKRFDAEQNDFFNEREAFAMLSCL